MGVIHIKGNRGSGLTTVAVQLFMEDSDSSILCMNSKGVRELSMLVPGVLANRIFSIQELDRLSGRSFGTIIVHDFKYDDPYLLEILGYGSYITPFITEESVIDLLTRIIHAKRYRIVYAGE